MNTKKWGPVIALAIIALALMIIGPTKRFASTPLTVPTPNQLEQSGSPTLGSGLDATQILTQTEWKGVRPITYGERIEWEMLTPHVSWQIRLNKDDTKVYTFRPGETDTELPECRIAEGRITPGQTTASGVIVWKIVKRK